MCDPNGRINTWVTFGTTGSPGIIKYEVASSKERELYSSERHILGVENASVSVISTDTSVEDAAAPSPLRTIIPTMIIGMSFFICFP
jgi:hypothetical protein